ncbi:MAG: DUF2279 domain-containing protein [Bacteroidetes bacterium]|nr:MAG: DUF2279 domain-containing protein [Bacteroidota bacterium]
MRIKLTILLLLFTLLVAGQQADSTQGKRWLNKKTIVTTGIVLQQMGSLYIEYKWWWEGNSHPFIWLNDSGFNNYSYGMDKLGHAYTSYLYFNVINESMKWAGYNEKQRLLWSIILPTSWALSIELGDAFSTWGFSVPDLLFNLGGIGYGVLQQRVPYMKNINFKYSYFPSRKYKEMNPNNWALTEDYDGHAYWLSFDLHHMLPGKLGKKWPAWLNIATGYSVDNYRYKAGTKMQREFLLSFDINLNGIRSKSAALNATKSILNLIHLPLPGIKHSTDGNTQHKLILLN